MSSIKRNKSRLSWRSPRLARRAAGHIMVESDDIVATVQLHQKAALNQEEVGLLWFSQEEVGLLWVAFARGFTVRPVQAPKIEGSTHMSSMSLETPSDVQQGLNMTRCQHSVWGVA